MKKTTGLLALLLVLCLAPLQAQAAPGSATEFRNSLKNPFGENTERFQFITPEETEEPDATSSATEETADPAPLSTLDETDAVSSATELSDVSGELSPCFEGDVGLDVRRVKARLKELGYYSSTATFDDEFNSIMVQRVKDFQENNGLSVTGGVNGYTLEALEADNPIRGQYYEFYWDEPEVTLIAPDITYARWDKRDCDQMGFSVEYKNVSTTRKVVAVELLVYTKDVWGNELISSDSPYSYTLNDTFGTGAKKYTGYMLIPYCSDTYEVCCAISKVRYDDGTTGYVDDPNYLCWTINW